ncbi:hypothetical protein QUF90_01975 [Desulfococcaceae bacterium HSG9]|nr:hypothetical protein [Desulfococcaceae bacterium HSG9]
MKHSLSLLSAFLVLFVTIVDVAGDTDTLNKPNNPQPVDINKTNNIDIQSSESNPAKSTNKQLKVVIIDFLPLPDSNQTNRHPLVFTGEYYSTSANLAKGEGLFIPNEYLNMMHSTLSTVLEMNGISVKLIPRSEIEKILEFSPDFVIFGAVKKVSVKTNIKKGEANDSYLSLHFNLFEGKTFKLLDKKAIEVTVSHFETPFMINEPVHIVGHHGRNFHFQRVLINTSIYAASLNILKIMKATGNLE